MTTPDVFRDAEYIADVSSIPYESVADLTDSQRSDSLRRQDAAMKKAQSAAKVAFIDRCLRDLDILVYCELSALYYMDCSVILFAIRAIVQLIFFTPKAPPFDPTRNQPFIGAIFASNFFCMIFHNFFIHPEAGEATRGYLHGGLFIDFIGQKAPISVFRLLSLDILILMIDFVMMGLIIERVKTVGATTSATANTTSNAQDAFGRQQQDYDSEERGVLRNAPGSSSAEFTGGDDGDGGVGPNQLGSHDIHTHPSVDEHLERTGLLADPSEHGHAHGARDSHALDTFASGEAVIMDIGLIDIIRDQWKYSPSTTSRRASPYVPSDETATFLRERFGLQVAPDGRVVRIER